MVPEGWVRRSLDQVADVRTGIAKGKSGLKNPVSLPYLRVANVQDGFLDLSEMKEIEVEASQVERYSLRINDIVLTEGGDFDKLGRGTIWRGQVPDCLHQNHVFAVRVTSDNLIPEFFAMQAGSRYGRNYFLSCAKRSTNLASINSSQLKQFPVLVPPLPEQQKIAEILSTWDKAIETTEALLANARTQKRALMQSLLTGTRRFPGFEDHPWHEVRLGDVCNIRKGEQKSKNTLYTEGPFPVINGGISPSGYTDEWNAKAGTITISEGGNSCGFANLMDVPFWSGGHCYTLEDLRIERDYLFFWLKFREAEIMRLRVGSGLPNIQKKAITNFPVIMPSSQEQARIVDVISFAFQEEKAIESNLDHLRTEKKSLMQQLLTGKRRVVV